MCRHVLRRIIGKLNRNIQTYTDSQVFLGIVGMHVQNSVHQAVPLAWERGYSIRWPRPIIVWQQMKKAFPRTESDTWLQQLVGQWVTSARPHVWAIHCTQRLHIVLTHIFQLWPLYCMYNTMQLHVRHCSVNLPYRHRVRRRTCRASWEDDESSCLRYRATAGQRCWWLHQMFQDESLVHLPCPVRIGHLPPPSLEQRLMGSGWRVWGRVGRRKEKGREEKDEGRRGRKRGEGRREQEG